MSEIERQRVLYTQLHPHIGRLTASAVACDTCFDLRLAGWSLQTCSGTRVFVVPLFVC